MASDPPVPQSSLARAVSLLAAPPLLAAAAVAVSASVVPGRTAWTWALAQLLLTVAIPLLYLLFLLRSGQVSNVDVMRREERSRPFLAMVLSAWLSWSVLLVGAAPAPLRSTAAILALEATLVYLITLGWKISLHCATAGAAGMVGWKLLGTPLPLVVLLPTVIWARLSLRRHTLTQTLAGAALGVMLAGLILWRFPLAS